MTPNTVLPPLPTPVANRNMAKLTKTFVYQDGPPPAHCIFQLQPLFTESQLRDYAIAALALRPGGEPSDEQIKAAIRKLTWDAIACEEDMQIARAVLALRPVGGADKPPTSEDSSEVGAQAPSPVAPSEPTDTDILSLMLCWAEGNTGDGEQGTDSEHIAEMRALFAKRAAIQPRQAEPPSDDTAAYHRGWHDGNATAKAAAVAEPRQAPSDALTMPEIPTPAMLHALWKYRDRMRGESENKIAQIHYAELRAAILSTQGDRNG